MSTEMHLLDVVALTKDIPDHGLRRGQVGTIVEVLGPMCSKWSSRTMKDEHTPPSR